MHHPVAAIPAFHAFGMEVEYMIVSERTLDAAPIAGAALEALAGLPAPERAPLEVSRGDFGWSNEFACHVLELKNPRVAAGLTRVAGTMDAHVAEMNQLLRARGARLMPGGMHPWMRPKREAVLWRYQSSAVYAAYDRIFNCRTHGWANLQSHSLSLPFAGDAEFARLHAAVRLVLPILPAVAASSPFVEGGAAASLDARIDAYESHTAAVPSLAGMLIPETAVSREQYTRDVLGPIYRDISAFDPECALRHEWVNARGAIPRFDRDAIEIRLLDPQECPAADLAIAALATDAAHHLYRQECAPLYEQQDIDTGTLARILFDCARDGERARITDAGYLRLLGYRGPACDAATLWADLATRMTRGRSAMRALWHGPLTHILREGPLARRLLNSAGRAPSRQRLAEVYRALCDCLDGGRQFSA